MSLVPNHFKCLLFLASPQGPNAAVVDSSENALVLAPSANPRLVSTHSQGNSRDLVVYVDGGQRHAHAALQHWKSRWPATPFPENQMWIGDGDSLNGAEVFALGPQIFLPPQKDVSDFGAALDWIQSEVLSARSTWQSVDLYVVGGLGGRRDHELANFLEAQNWVSARSLEFSCPALVQFEKKISVVNGALQWQSKGTWSLFGTKWPCSAKISGATYEGECILGRPSHGLSNESDGEVPTLVDTQGQTFLLFK